MSFWKMPHGWTSAFNDHLDHSIMFITNEKKCSWLDLCAFGRTVHVLMWEWQWQYCFLEPNVTTSNSARCDVYRHKKERENQLHSHTDLQKLKQAQRLGLTVAFARDLAKHVPLDLNFLMIFVHLMRVIATGNRASLHLAGAWATLRYLHR